MPPARRPHGARPALLSALQHYDRRKAVADLIAGVTVGLVALPLALAFAISSGLPPQAGIYTAVVAGGLISLLGGSRLQIGGPTGAFVVIVAGIVAEHGVEGLFVCTLMAGAMLVLLGATGMGSAVRFIPRPVVVGFTNGIAVLIVSTQIRDFLGLQIERLPSDFLPRMKVVASQLPTWSPHATALAAGSLLLIVAVARLSKRIPGAILALAAGTAAVVAFDLPVETIGTRFGGIPSGLPPLHIPVLRPELLPALLVPAMTVAMLGAIESLMSAMVADRMTGGRHDPNVELIAQGVANLASPLFGGLPATGAIARTATNIRSGAQTPVAGIIHALTLAGILLAAAPLAQYVPLPVLAAILLVVAYNMGDWGEIPELLRLTRTDILVWLVTFALTVFADLTQAVGVGMVCAALLFIKRVADTTTVSVVTDDYQQDAHMNLQNHTIPPYVRIVRIHGPFLFGATDKLRSVLHDTDALPPILILKMRNVTALDATGLRAIEELAEALHASGRHLLLCGARHQPAELIARADFHRHIGDANICVTVNDALNRARELQDAETGARPGRPA
ncbi:MAG TPA: sulfate permease [Vicinamibacterales bacterium]|nr:sulfate permease [Vicinamibacterales bacterium]